MAEKHPVDRLPPQPSPLRRAVSVVTAVEMSLAAAATVVIFILVLLQAGQRYLPVDGWTWTGELARYSLVWLTFVAAGVLVTRDGHIALKLVDSIPNPLVVRGIQVLALLVVAATGAGLAYECWSLITSQSSLTTPSLGMPIPVVYALPLLGFVSTCVRAVLAAVVVARHGIRASDYADAESLDLHADRGEAR